MPFFLCNTVLDFFFNGVLERELIEVIVKKTGNLVSGFFCDILQAGVEADIFLKFKSWFNVLLNGDDVSGEVELAVLSNLTGQLYEIFSSLLIVRKQKQMVTLH